MKSSPIGCVDFLRLPPGTISIPYLEQAPANNLHFGQLKLLLGEFYFLSRVFASQEDLGGRATVVYASSAPGDHLPTLAELFPLCTFHWFDSRQPGEALISAAASDPSRFVLYEDLFSIELISHIGKFIRA